MEAVRRKHVDPVLHRERRQVVPEHVLRLATDGVVAGDEGDGDAEMAAEERVQPGFTRRLAVQQHVLDFLAEQCVGEDALLGAGAGVIADEDGGIDALVDALHHAHGLVKALDHAGARIDLLDEQVAHDPVRVVHHDLGRPGVERPEDRRVRVTGHEDPPALVVGSLREDVLRIGHGGSAFHVD
jgi:hypothetical protein